MNKDVIMKKAKEIGFSEVGVIIPSEMKFLQEVRDMCAANRCNKYGTCWTCPPGCGSLEDISSKAKSFDYGIVLQTVGQLEDSFDFDNMVEAEKIQKHHFDQLVKFIANDRCKYLPMATGACELCETCTYPDAPCRFPSLAFPSMESYGLLVNDICEQAELKYYHGPNTVTYTACILIGE